MKASRLIVAFLFIAMLVMTVGRVPGASAATSATTSIAITAAQQKAALAQWTHEAIAKQAPMAMPVDAGAPGTDVPVFAQDLGVAGFSAPGAAQAGADAILKSAYAGDWKALAADAAAIEAPTAGSPSVFTSYIVNAWQPAQTIYPHKWVGRLSMSAGYCSATALSANNFVTAAHCVYDTGTNHWYSNWVFTPGYRNGSAPYGSFAATTCTVLTAWVNLSGSYSINGWTKYDVAVCTVGKNSAGLTLNGAIGYAGQSWNYGYDRSFTNMGYPWKDTSNNNLSSAGAYLRLCSAESFTQTTDTMGMGCNWGPGISGGPWMVAYAQSYVQGYVNSVNSGMYIGSPNLYGIRFTSNNFRLVCTARGC